MLNDDVNTLSNATDSQEPSMLKKSKPKPMTKIRDGHITFISVERLFCDKVASRSPFSFISNICASAMLDVR